jgi:hypothetical protein
MIPEIEGDALDRTGGRACFVTGCGTVVRLSTKLMDECLPVVKFHPQFYTTEITCAVKEYKQITDNYCELNATTRFSQDQYNKYCRQSAWTVEAVHTVVLLVKPSVFGLKDSYGREHRVDKTKRIYKSFYNTFYQTRLVKNDW